ncbi:MAG: hypothetical protein WBA12_09225 [Catalinimonas sp.]
MRRSITQLLPLVLALLTVACAAPKRYGAYFQHKPGPNLAAARPAQTHPAPDAQLVSNDEAAVAQLVAAAPAVAQLVPTDAPAAESELPQANMDVSQAIATTKEYTRAERRALRKELKAKVKAAKKAAKGPQEAQAEGEFRTSIIVAGIGAILLVIGGALSINAIYLIGAIVLTIGAILFLLALLS